MSFLPLVSLLLLLNTGKPAPYCGDGHLYAWSKQTAEDPRFNAFPKIEGRDGPKYMAGDKRFDRYIRERLVLDEEAKPHTFVLNYYFTVRCDGTVSDVEVLGDPVVKNWTNIETIVQHTTGWKPAYRNGKPVDCIFFRTLMIDGSKH